MFSDKQAASVRAERLDTCSNESQNEDDALTVYHSYSAEEAAALEKRLVRKLDTRLMPVVVLIYILNYIDRNSIAQARLYGLEEDAGVKDAMWNTAISILSVGYIAMQIPATLYMAKTSRPSIFLPSCMILWAIVSGCTAFVTSTASLLVVRFFLGIVEAPFFPCAIYLLSCWYRKRELGKRMALLVSGLITSNAFAGLLAAGILSGMTNAAGLHTWQWLFIIEGLVTIFVAVCAMFILPDYPGNTRWLTPEERKFAQARLAADVGSTDLLESEKCSALDSLRRAIKDYRVWLFACMQMACTASISFSHFFPTLVSDLGFENHTTTLLLTSPPYVVGFFWAITLAWRADKQQVRSTYAAISAAVALVGAIVTIALPSGHKWANYAMMFLLVCGTYGVYCTTYAWLSSTIVRPPAKRAVSVGIANSMANVASFYGNYFWLDQYGPAYKQSWGCIVGFVTLCLSCILVLRFLLRRKNQDFERRVEEKEARRYVDESSLSEEELRALKQGFRYVT